MRISSSLFFTAAPCLVLAAALPVNKELNVDPSLVTPNLDTAVVDPSIVDLPLVTPNLDTTAVDQPSVKPAVPVTILDHIRTIVDSSSPNQINPEDLGKGLAFIVLPETSANNLPENDLDLPEINTDTAALVQQATLILEGTNSRTEARNIKVTSVVQIVTDTISTVSTTKDGLWSSVVAGTFLEHITQAIPVTADPESLFLIVVPEGFVDVHHYLGSLSALCENNEDLDLEKKPVVRRDDAIEKPLYVIGQRAGEIVLFEIVIQVNTCALVGVWDWGVAQ